MITQEDRYAGTLIGLACGDYLGEPSEYCYSPQAIKEMFGEQGVQPFAWKRGDMSYPAGFYTDDTSQALCLAQSLIDNGFDAQDQLQKYRRWFLEGYMAAIPERGAFGMGQQTLKILIDANHKIPEALGNVTRAGGNGALMRCVPIGLCYLGDDQLIKRYSIQSAIVTHDNAVAAWSCVVINQFVSWIITETVTRVDLIAAFLKKYSTDCPIEIKSMLEYVADGGQFAGTPTGYSLNTLQIALESFLSTDNFQDAITKAIYYGGDTDTQAAVTGGISGAFYGVGGIPEEWRFFLLNKGFIADIAVALSKSRHSVN
jgi:ADP-ribosyl-[dinitrogen reductase] hydrolase